MWTTLIVLLCIFVFGVITYRWQRRDERIAKAEAERQARIDEENRRPLQTRHPIQR